MRSLEVEMHKKCAERYPDGFPDDYDHQGWLDKYGNLMYVEDDDVGLFTYEYDGVYTGHWFFASRGKVARQHALTILNDVFSKNNAKVIRGFTPEKKREASWLARNIGFKSLGMVECIDGPHELFCLTRQDFYDRNRNNI